MKDGRTALLRHFWRLFDSSPTMRLDSNNPPQPMQFSLTAKLLLQQVSLCKAMDLLGKRWKRTANGWCHGPPGAGLFLCFFLIAFEFNLQVNHSHSFWLQNCKKRSLSLRWCTLTGHDVGAEVLVSEFYPYSLAVLIISPLKVWRQRTFFLICKQGFLFFQAKLSGFADYFNGSYVKTCSWCPSINVQSMTFLCRAKRCWRKLSWSRGLSDTGIKNPGPASTNGWLMSAMKLQRSAWDASATLQCPMLLSWRLSCWAMLKWQIVKPFGFDSISICQLLVKPLTCWTFGKPFTLMAFRFDNFHSHTGIFEPCWRKNLMALASRSAQFIESTNSVQLHSEFLAHGKKAVSSSHHLSQLGWIFHWHNQHTTVALCCTYLCSLYFGLLAHVAASRFLRGFEVLLPCLNFTHWSVSFTTSFFWLETKECCSQRQCCSQLVQEHVCMSLQAFGFKCLEYVHGRDKKQNHTNQPSLQSEINLWFDQYLAKNCFHGKTWDFSSAPIFQVARVCGLVAFQYRVVSSVVTQPKTTSSISVCGLGKCDWKEILEGGSRTSSLKSKCVLVTVTNGSTCFKLTYVSLLNPWGCCDSMDVVRIHDVQVLSDDDQPRGPRRQQVAKRRPAKRKANTQLAVNTPPNGRELRQRVEGSCGCLCECFIPFRLVLVFDKLLKLRQDLARLDKVEQDNSVWPWVGFNLTWIHDPSVFWLLDRSSSCYKGIKRVLEEPGAWHCFSIQFATKASWNYWEWESTDSWCLPMLWKMVWIGLQWILECCQEKANLRVSNDKQSSISFGDCMSNLLNHCRTRRTPVQTRDPDKENTSMIPSTCLAMRWGISRQVVLWITWGYAGWNAKTFTSPDNCFHLSGPQRNIFSVLHVFLSGPQVVNWTQIGFNLCWGVDGWLPGPSEDQTPRASREVFDVLSSPPDHSAIRPWAGSIVAGATVPVASQQAIFG